MVSVFYYLLEMLLIICFQMYWFLLTMIYAKTLAEEASWKFAKVNGIDMVTIHPRWVIGPLLQPTLNLSVEEV